MRSSRPFLRLSAALAVLASVAAPRAGHAQQEAAGFAVERLVLSPPGNRWLVMDDLAQQGGLGGAASFTLGQARRPLVVRARDGSTSLPVVEDQSFMDVGVAVTWHEARVYAHFSSPLQISGRSGTVDGWTFTAPDVTLQLRPDAISDVHLGFDARLVGRADGPVRAGVDLQLVFPSGDRFDYLTDNTYRAIGRVVVAGDAGALSWASHAGVHLRPLDEPPPGSPRGSELLFGAAAGAELPFVARGVIVGAELHGATAFRSLFGAETTALEVLFEAAYRSGGVPSPLGVKVGAGAGLHPRFGAPDWRAVVQFEAAGLVFGP